MRPITHNHRRLVIDSHQCFVRLYQSNFPSYISSELDFVRLPRTAVSPTCETSQPDQSFLAKSKIFRQVRKICGGLAWLEGRRLPP